MSGSEVYATVGELTTPTAIEQARVVGRAFEIFWRDCADPHALSADVLAASAFRAGFDLARQLFLDTQRAGARPDDPSAGCAESGGSDPLAATPAPQNDSTSGGPPPAVTRQWRSGEKVPASGIYATDHVRVRQATLKRGARFPPSHFPWSLVREARHVS